MGLRHIAAGLGAGFGLVCAWQYKQHNRVAWYYGPPDRQLVLYPFPPRIEKVDE